MTPDDPSFGQSDEHPTQPMPLRDDRGSQLPAVSEGASTGTAVAPLGGAAWLEEPDAGEGIRFGSFLHSLRRRWMMAAGWGLLLATSLAAVLWWLIPENYEAVAYLQVLPEPDSLLGKPQYKGTDKAYEIFKQTQKELLTGPLVLTAALRQPGISQLPMIRDEGDTVVEWLMDELSAVTSPEVQMIIVRLKGPDKDQPVKIVDAVLNAYNEEIVMAERTDQNRLLQILTSELTAKTLDYEKKQRDFNALADKSLAVPDSEATQLASRLAVSELADLSRKKQKVEEQYSEAMRQLQMTQSAIQAGRQTPSDFWIDEELERDYEYFDQKQMIDQMEKQYRYVSGIARQDSASLLRLGQQMAIANRELEKLKAEKKPRIVAKIQRMVGADEWSVNSVIGPLRAQIGMLQQEWKLIEKEYAKKREEFKELSRASTELLTKKQELVNLEEYLKELAMRTDSLSVNLRQPARVKTLQKASVPKEESDWKLKWAEIAGAWLLVFGGTLVGIALWDYQGKRVNSTKDVDGPGTGLRVVGSLPLLDGNASRGLWPFSRMDDRQLEVVLNFSMDSIRAALLYSRATDKIKVVMIASAQGQEGRSTVASQLAVSMARSGLRTLLVDADIRNPQQHLVFGVSGERGFCDMLRGNVNTVQAVQPTAVEGLWIMAAGRLDQACLQAMSSEKARSLFSNLRSRYDFIVIDVGPVLTSADALLIGQHVDTALISVRRDVSQIPKIYAACDRLRGVGVHVMGAVVNGAGTEIRRNELNAVTHAPALPEPGAANGRVARFFQGFFHHEESFSSRSCVGRGRGRHLCPGEMERTLGQGPHGAAEPVHQSAVRGAQDDRRLGGNRRGG